MAALVGAAFVRLYALGDIPVGILGDESAHGLEALRIGAEGWIGVWTPVALGQPAGPLYLFAAFVNPFPNEIWSVRLGAALLGLATLPIFFLFCRRLFGVRAALYGSVLLAFSLWHIHYSRLALPVDSLPLIEVLSLWLLLMGLGRDRSSRARLALLIGAGAALGLGAYSYSMFPWFVVVVLAVWARELLSQGSRTHPVARDALVFFAAAALVAVPFIVFVAGHWSTVVERSRSVSVTRTSEYEELDGVAERSRFVIGEVAHIATIPFRSHKVDSSDGAGGRPLLDPLTGSLTVVGLLLCLRRPGDLGHFLVLAGVLASVVGTALTLEQGENRRLIGALPFVFAGAGYALDRVTSLLEGRLGWRPIYILLAAAVAFVVWHNAATYFDVYARSNEHRWTFAHRLVEAARHVQEIEGEPYVYFYSPRWSVEYESVRYLLPNLRGEDRSAEFGEPGVEADLARGAVLYLAMPPYGNSLEQAQVRYPGGELFEAAESGEVLFGTYYLERLPDGERSDEG